jgi:hypothetical protein
MSMRATGQEAKELKEREAEEAIARMAESNYNKVRTLKGRCFGCCTPGPGICGGCGAYIDDHWNGGSYA